MLKWGGNFIVENCLFGGGLGMLQTNFETAVQFGRSRDATRMSEINQGEEFYENCQMGVAMGAIFHTTIKPRGFSHIRKARQVCTVYGCKYSTGHEGDGSSFVTQNDLLTKI